MRLLWRRKVHTTTRTGGEESFKLEEEGGKGRGDPDKLAGQPKNN